MDWKLYSLRWSVAKGWHWRVERDGMSKESAESWWDIYCRDERAVTFKISKNKRKPRLPDMRRQREIAPTMLGR